MLKISFSLERTGDLMACFGPGNDSFLIDSTLFWKSRTMKPQSRAKVITFTR